MMIEVFESFEFLNNTVFLEKLLFFLERSSCILTLIDLYNKMCRIENKIVPDLSKKRLLEENCIFEKFKNFNYCFFCKFIKSCD